MLPTNRQPTHPGKILLQEFLRPANITQQQLAQHMGWSFARVNEVVNGKRGISAVTALSLAEAFNNSPKFWLNLESNWELWHAGQKHTHIPRLVDNQGLAGQI